MRIEWWKDKTAPRARTIGLATNEQICLCAMADEETGEYDQYAYCPEEKRFILGPDKLPVVVKGRSRIRIDLLLPDEPSLDPSRPPRYARSEI